MTDERARLFVALELPDAARSALVDWREGAVREVSGLRAVAQSSLHVTLCFIGSRPASEVSAVVAACRTVAGLPEVTLSFAHGIWLPKRRPRVLAVALEDEGGALGHVQSTLAEALAGGGWYEIEARPFLAHVTVVRVGRGTRVRAPELPAIAPKRFTGDAVTLFRSRLGAGAARYEGIETVRLRA